MLRQIISGPLWDAARDKGGLPIRQTVVLCDFLSAFISKGRVGRHARAIARNGLILLMNAIAAERMEGMLAELDLRTWNRCILADSAPEPYGVLMVLRPANPEMSRALPHHFRTTDFGSAVPTGSALTLELGGDKFLSILS